jgi:hypothetical protein
MTSSEVLRPEFVVKNTFIDVCKANRPTLRRVVSDSSIHYSDYGKSEKNSRRYNWADAETSSEITDEDCSAWTETDSTVTDDEFDDAFGITPLPVYWNGCPGMPSLDPRSPRVQNEAVDTLNLDTQATHLRAQSQNTEVAQFVRQAAQLNWLKSQAQEARDLAQQSHQAMLAMAQAQEARLRELRSAGHTQHGISSTPKRRNPASRPSSQKKAHSPEPSFDPLLYSLCC